MSRPVGNSPGTYTRYGIARLGLLHRSVLNPRIDGGASIAGGMGFTTGDSYGKGASDLPFENILNLRDVGATVNEFLGPKYVAESQAWKPLIG